MRPENHQNIAPKHKNYDPKLPQDQAEKSQIPKNHAKKGSKQDQNTQQIRQRNLGKFRNETEIKITKQKL